jgi:hypothetical protein
MRIIWLPDYKTRQDYCLGTLAKNYRSGGSGCLSAKKIYEHTATAKVLV